jgi:glycosyltransferase involved in cell wall biosynthesis
MMGATTRMTQPLVSVVTPFYNTAPYLTECIESVLGQTYSNFEYILADNCSTDGSTKIAETYARREPRIRLIRCPQLLPQLPNYNRALWAVSDASKYCKIVEADNYILPECLRLMVQAFEQSESIGLVSSYYLFGDVVHGSGYPHRKPMFPGREWARRYLRDLVHVFGSPTTVMYRSSIVRQHRPFYDESALHADTEKCLEILKQWDFGFVHQVLSFMRTDNVSISSTLRPLRDGILDWYILMRRYAPVFLEPEEAASLRRKAKQTYYRVLARQAVRLREPAFWRYHKEGLRTLGESIDWFYLTLRIGRELLWLASNPGLTTAEALRSWGLRSRESGRRLSTFRNRATDQ